MYRFKVEYYCKYKNQPQKALTVNVTATNYTDAQNKAIKIINAKYPGAYYNIWQITKTKKYNIRSKSGWMGTGYRSAWPIRGARGY